MLLLGRVATKKRLKLLLICQNIIWKNSFFLKKTPFLGSILMKHIIKILILSLIPICAFSQNAGGNDFFSNIGKIYVTVGVLLILFAGMIGFLIYLERKVARLEQDIEE